MMKKLIVAGVTFATALGALALDTGTSYAREGRHGAFAAGAAAGVVGGAILGGALSNNRGYYDDDQPVYYARRCHIERRFVDDGYDGHYERVRVCVRPGY